MTLKTANKEKIFLSPESVLSMDTNLLTLRNLLSTVNAVYDPLGLVAPITIRLRAAFTSSSVIEWDTPLHCSSQKLWLSLMVLVCAGKTTFHRNTISLTMLLVKVSSYLSLTGQMSLSLLPFIYIGLLQMDQCRSHYHAQKLRVTTLQCFTTSSFLYT